MKTLLLFGMLLAAVPAGAKGKARPSITMEEARATALARIPGTVKKAELEEEKGLLIYSFDIRDKSGQIMEVQVDAKSGAVVSVERE